MKSIYDIEKELEELQEYADMEGSELGEVWNLLISIARYPDYISEKFSENLVEEILFHLDEIKKIFKVVEKKETYTRTYLELVDKRDE